jgi:hypothetical protein
MIYLPSELLHKIFIQLPLGQRVKCMLLCRHWFEIFWIDEVYCTTSLLTANTDSAAFFKPFNVRPIAYFKSRSLS